MSSEQINRDVPAILEHCGGGRRVGKACKSNPLCLLLVSRPGSTVARHTVPSSLNLCRKEWGWRVGGPHPSFSLCCCSGDLGSALAWQDFSSSTHRLGELMGRFPLHSQLSSLGKPRDPGDDSLDLSNSFSGAANQQELSMVHYGQQWQSKLLVPFPSSRQPDVCMCSCAHGTMSLSRKKRQCCDCNKLEPPWVLMFCSIHRIIWFWLTCQFSSLYALLKVQENRNKF